MNFKPFLPLLATSIMLTEVSYAQLASYCTGPVIIMEAEGEVESIPDMAEITITVKTENKDANIALQDLANSIQNVIDVLDNLNIKDKDVRTDTVNIFPVYEGRMYAARADQEITGYAGTSFIYFKTQDVDDLTSLMDNVMNESKNLFSNIQYSSSEQDNLESKAREIAYNKAFTKAKQYAEISGNKLGDICTITEGDIKDVTDFYNSVAFAQAMRGRMPNIQSVSQEEIPRIPIKPGTIKITSKVSVIYQLEN